MHKTNTILNSLSIFAIFIIIALFYFACYQYTYNFFYQDDFHLLRFVTIFQDESVGFYDKIKTLYDQHNEHRIIIPRLFVLFDYYLQGHLDWQVLNTVAALYYLGIFTLFALVIRKIKLPIWYILPIALLIFQPAAYENFYWTISILQQVGNLFWAMFLFYSLVYFAPKYFWISIISIIILTFTHGNGLFAFGVGGLILFLQKRYKELFIWIAIMIAVAAFYFLGYYTAQNSNIAGSLSNPLRLIGCFGGFWGNFIKDFFKTNDKIMIAIGGGLIIFSSLLSINIKVIFTYFFPNKKSAINLQKGDESYFLLAIFIFLSITAGLVALSRSWSSIEAGFQNRYLHNSVIALVLLYVSVLNLKLSVNFKKSFGIVFLFFGLFFNAFSWYTKYETLVFQKNSQESDSVNYQINGISIVNDKSFNQNIRTYLKQSFDEGISVFPASPLTNVVKNLEQFQAKQTTGYSIDIKKDSSLTFNISNSNYRAIYYFTNVSLPFTGDIYLVFKSAQNTFISPTTHRRNSKISFLKTANFFTDGFYTSVMTDAMPSNEYSVGILQNVNHQFVYIPSKYKIQN
jgi:hypothetical protein